MKVVRANCNEAFEISKSGCRGHALKGRKVRLCKDLIGGDVQPRHIWLPTHDCFGDVDVHCLIAFVDTGGGTRSGVLPIVELSKRYGLSNSALGALGKSSPREHLAAQQSKAGAGRT